jgi:mono/diheme cytochrome c family protein
MSTISDDDLRMVIKEGGAAAGKSPAMMAFTEALTEDDARDVIAYIRHLCCR